MRLGGKQILPKTASCLSFWNSNPPLRPHPISECVWVTGGYDSVEEQTVKKVSLWICVNEHLHSLFWRTIQHCDWNFKSATFGYLAEKIPVVTFTVRHSSYNYFDKRETFTLSLSKDWINDLIYSRKFLVSVVHHLSWPIAMSTKNDFNCNFQACKSMMDIFQSSFETSCLPCCPELLCLYTRQQMLRYYSWSFLETVSKYTEMKALVC